MAATELPNVPSAVASALGALPSILASAGYVVTEVTAPNSFGNFAVAYVGPRGRIQISRDRGQLIMSGPTREELESFGLWRTFSGARDVESPLKLWLGTASEA